MHWLHLMLAIVFEISGTTCMKLSQGFTKPLPAALMVVFYCISFTFLTLALKTMDLSIAYAIWAGLGTALLARVGFRLGSGLGRTDDGAGAGGQHLGQRPRRIQSLRRAHPPPDLGGQHRHLQPHLRRARDTRLRRPHHPRASCARHHRRALEVGGPHSAGTSASDSTTASPASVSSDRPSR